MIKKKICFVVNIDYVVNNFLINHIDILSKIYDITVVVNADSLPLLKKRKIKARLYKIEFIRGLKFWLDLQSILKLFHFLVSNRFDAVHSVTSKIGFFSMLTSYIARVNFRIHIFTGQVWLNDKGFKRFAFKSFDRMTAFFSTHLLVDSKSQMTFLNENKIGGKKKLLMLGNGSIAGVDIKKFKPNLKLRNEIRSSLSIPSKALCLIFVGRLNHEKGIIDLLHSLSYLNNSDIFLILVGNDEENIIEHMSINFKLQLNNIKYVGYSDNPEKFMVASDILCLPSYREGFGSVIIEASACGLPSIGSNIYGIKDAIVDNKSGLLHKPGSQREISSCINHFFQNPKIIKKMGTYAKNRVRKSFQSKYVTDEWVKFYAKIFN